MAPAAFTASMTPPFPSVSKNTSPKYLDLLDSLASADFDFAALMTDTPIDHRRNYLLNRPAKLTALAGHQFGLFAFEPLRLTSPGCRTRRAGAAFAPLANAVTDQGLGEVSKANGAGNPVLYAVPMLFAPTFDPTIPHRIYHSNYFLPGLGPHLPPFLPPKPGNPSALVRRTIFYQSFWPLLRLLALTITEG